MPSLSSLKHLLASFPLLLLLLLFLSSSFSPSIIVQGFEIPLPGGRSIKYNQDTGVLRINLNDAKSNKKLCNIPIPPKGTKINQDVIDSIEIRDTGIHKKGFGAFAKNEIKSGAFLGFYEGEVIKSRERLDDIVKMRKGEAEEAVAIAGSEINERTSIGAMDYVMSLDGGVTFIDGFER